MCYKVNPLLDWIVAYVVFKKGNQIGVGLKFSDPDKYLWLNYLRYYRNHNFSPLSFNDFSNALVQQLNLFSDNAGIAHVTKKRTMAGVVLENIDLLKTSNMKVGDAMIDELDLTINNYRYYEIFGKFVE